MAQEPKAAETPEKSDEEKRREAAERALQANARRNADQLARREAIADSAEQSGDHVGDEDLTDEMWNDVELPENVRTARAIAKAMAEGEGGDEEEGEEEAGEEGERPKNDQGEEAKDDEAREAGADDVRVVDGVKEYRLVINGKEQWRTLAQIRTSASKVEAADEYLQVATDAARKATRAAPSAEEVEEANRQKQERRAHLKELLRRQAMGDEQAIDELTELFDATPSAVTPDVLRALDERFDSRVTFREAVTWFEDEYSDELKHQAMKSYAGELDAALAQENPTMPAKERLRQVGNQIRKELQTAYGVGRQGQGPSEKARRKAEVRRPTPAGERQPTKDDETEEESPSSVINKIAQGRHQPRAVVHGPIRNR
jgi:hypothetical protein